jgi:iron-sulfur cluster repair protein YtfE (RIC family)
MQRDPRLRQLSSDHHRALVLARRALAAPADPAIVEQVRHAFDRELDPHFRAEEEALLPALAAAGEAALVERTLTDHRALCDLAGRLGQPGVLAEFADRLKAHVRFEEQVLFPTAEHRLDAATLDAIARRSAS